MSLLALQVVTAAREPIPTPGLMTISLRLVASGGALIACGLLLLMWAYRRRIYISQWAIAWAFASLTLLIASDADSGGVSTIALGVAAASAIASTTHVLAGLRRYEGVTNWRRRVGWLTATLAALLLVPRLVSSEDVREQAPARGRRIADVIDAPRGWMSVRREQGREPRQHIRLRATPDPYSNAVIPDP